MSRLFSILPGGYDAADDRGRRRAPVSVTYAEDRIANERIRRILTANAQDLARNFAIARWAIGKHLDYVTSFSFQAKTADQAFNRELEAFIEFRSAPGQFDIAGRHPRRRAIRLSEACRTVSGDNLWVKILSPGPVGDARSRIQFIESDRIKNPTDRLNDETWVNGVNVNKAGASLGYAIHNRRFNSSQFDFARVIPARNAYLHAWYDRFDQVRGISPISAALNWFRDVYEGFEYTLARTKIEQLFGLQVFRDASEPMGPTTPTVDTDGDDVADSGYQIDFAKGPFMLDLNPGDKVDTLNGGNPAGSTTDFLKLMIHVALRTLDIPYSFFDESFTNFYGSRGGLIQYLKACENKIADIQDCLNWWANWVIGLAVADGTIRLPRSMEFADIYYEHVPAGVPWWDPAKEARGQSMGIAMGVTSPQRVCREVGTDFETNIDEIAQAMEYAKSKGVDLVYADSTAFAPEITVGEPDAAK